MARALSFAIALGSLTFVACGGSSGDSSPSTDDASTDASSQDSSTNDGAHADAPPTDSPSSDTDAGTGDGTPVYPGCPSPATTFARTIYVDPATGKDTNDGSKSSPLHTLATALTAKKISAGDHVVLLPGDHGAVTVSKYTNPELSTATSWSWFDFQPGATTQMLVIGDMSDWLVTHAEMSADATVAKTALLTITSSTNVVVSDAHAYTIKDSKSWTATDWINVAASGAFVRNGSCISLVRDQFLNTRFGIAILSDAKARPDSSMKVLVQDSEVARFSGDAMRVIASDVTVKGNYLHDVYVSGADGDDNHDDGLQMWALDGATYDNIRIESNWVQETTEATRPLQNSLQGIDDFDGVNTNVVITNNVVLASAYHGIALYGSQDSTMDHNTVANPTTNGNELWLGVFDDKTGAPSTNIHVNDNAATTFNFSKATTGFVESNDIVVADPASAYVKFDTAAMVFDLTAKKGSVLDGKGAGATLAMPKGLP